jgi:hypothetical protein
MAHLYHTLSGMALRDLLSLQGLVTAWFSFRSH